jgi:hypothetical protein
MAFQFDGCRDNSAAFFDVKYGRGNTLFPSPFFQWDVIKNFLSRKLGLLCDF